MTHTEIDELLPFYANGTLSADERARVEQYLSEHPAAARQLAWYRGLREQLLADVPAVSSEIGLERAMSRIRAERPAPAAAAAPAPAPATPSMADRLRSVLAGLMPQAVLRPALAAALAAVVGQGVWIAHLSGEPPTSELRAVPATVVDKGPYLKVNFKSDAREADIRMLLVGVNGSLAGGPGQLGDWFVRVPGGDIEAVASQLRSNPIVDGVAVVDALPVRP